MVKECQRLSIPLALTPTTNSEETKAQFRATQADVGLSLGNSYIAPTIFGIPRLGMVNVHHEVLPEYQRARSVIWQIYEGSVETGYTIHEINHQLDAGLILLLKKYQSISKTRCLKLSVGITPASFRTASSDWFKSWPISRRFVPSRARKARGARLHHRLISNISGCCTSTIS